MNINLSGMTPKSDSVFTPRVHSAKEIRFRWGRCIRYTYELVFILCYVFWKVPIVPCLILFLWVLTKCHLEYIGDMHFKIERCIASNSSFSINSIWDFKWFTFELMILLCTSLSQFFCICWQSIEKRETSVTHASTTVISVFQKFTRLHYWATFTPLPYNAHTSAVHYPC